MKYRVIDFFVDLYDGNHIYNIGDEYPWSGGKQPSQIRIASLLSDRNKQSRPLIEAIDDEPEVKPPGETKSDNAAPDNKAGD